MLATKLDVVLKAAKSSAPPPAAAPSAESMEVPGFESAKVFTQLAAGTGAMSPGISPKCK